VRTAHNFISKVTWKKENILQPGNHDYLCGLETHWPQGKLVMHRVTNTHARDVSCQRSLQLNLNFNLSYKLKCWEWERLTVTRQKDHSHI